MQKRSLILSAAALTVLLLAAAAIWFFFRPADRRPIDPSASMLRFARAEQDEVFDVWLAVLNEEGIRYELKSADFAEYPDFSGTACYVAGADFIKAGSALRGGTGNLAAQELQLSYSMEELFLLPFQSEEENLRISADGYAWQPEN